MRVLIALLLAGALLLPACAQRAVEPEPTPEPQVVTLRLQINGNIASRELDTIINAFMRANPNVRVVVVPFLATEDFSTLRSRLKAGEVDLTYAWATLADEGLLLPLDRYIQRDGFDLTPLGSLAGDLRHNGTLYYLPTDAPTFAIVYNLDHFAAAGLEPPKELWTWEELRLLAARLTVGEGEAKRWGFHALTPGWLAMVQASQRKGGALTESDADMVRQSLQFFASMIFADRSMPPGPTISDEGRLQRLTADPFREGRTAMAVVLGSGTFTGYGQMGIRFGVVPLPVQPGGQPYTEVSPTTYGIAANTPHPDAAWALLRHLAGAEGAEIRARHGMMPAYRTPAVRTTFFEQQPPPPPGSELFFAVDLRTESVKPGRLVQEVHRALSGQIPWEEALAGYQANTP